ncbi:hypothetical protein D3C85_1539640 [compost metagenome]
MASSVVSTGSPLSSWMPTSPKLDQSCQPALARMAHAGSIWWYRLRVRVCGTSMLISVAAPRMPRDASVSVTPGLNPSGSKWSSNSRSIALV